MKIYTKQGDKGDTSVYAKKVLKVSKDDAIIECYGTLDELNSHLGLISSYLSESNSETLPLWSQAIENCQQHLFLVGFALSDDDKLTLEHVSTLEQYIDDIQQQLPSQTHFILPGGSLLSSLCHVARTVARRAERSLVRTSKIHNTSPIALSYVNRLSDFLFVLARLCNFSMQIEDIKV